MIHRRNAVIVIVVGGAALGLLRFSGRDRDVATELDGCDLKVGATLAYEVHESLVGEMNLRPLLTSLQGSPLLQTQASPPQEKREDKEWRVELQVEATEHDGAVLGARIEDPSTQPPTQLGDPFLVRISSSCSIIDFARKEDALRTPSKQQQQIFSLLQWSVPGPEGSVRGFDRYGEFAAHAKLRASEGRSAVITQRVRYERGFGSTDPFDVVSSSLTVWPGTSGWFDVLQGDLDLSLRVREAQVAKVRSRFSANRGKGRSVSIPFPVTDARWVWGHVLGDPPAAPERPPPRVIAGLSEKPFREVLDNFTALLERGSTTYERLEYLRAYFAANPAALEDALRLLRDPRALADKFGGRGELILAMALSGTPESRRALMKLLTDPTFPVDDQHRAAWSFVQVSDRPPELLPEVVRRAKDRANPYDRGVMSLVLGALGNRSLGRDEETVASASAQIRDWLEHSQSKDELIDALGAVANSGSDSLVASTLPYLDDSDQDLRKSAAAALRNMPFDRVEPEVQRRYAVEDDTLVRTTLLDSALRSAVSPGNSLTALAQQAVNRMHDGAVPRGEYFETLRFVGGAAQRGDAGARSALEAELRAEVASGSKDVAKIEALSPYLAPSWKRNAQP
ncbi:MAG: hypothetical protein HYV07_17570 [Deltaproteobacteria bacterium]|nr:hypothetical protein [Deltaproteobacteria bacterium]